jgi:hypothetical protein
MKIDIMNIVEQTDGSSIVFANLDSEAVLAELGFNKLVADAAERVLKEQDDGHSDPEGEGDGQAGERGDKPLP